MALSKRYLIALFFLAACAKSPDAPVRATCRDLLVGCRLDTGIKLRFSQRPGVMQTFDLEVEAPEMANLHAVFQMQGMEMGMNRYRLLRQNGKWYAKVMLPACVQGRRDWSLQLEVNGKIYEVPFVAG
jgi:hypothetical protein